jgi:hypothetical protein
MAEERSCGDCQACCVLLGVRELEKPRHHACVHMGPKGCGIYADRPQACRDYQCGWLTGFGTGPAERPDRLGLIVDRPANLPDRVVAREVWRGAFGRRRVKKILEALHRSGVKVQLVPFAGRALPIGKPL